MTSIREQIEADCEDVATSVKQFKQAIRDLTELQSQLFVPLSAANTALRVIQSKSFINKNDPLMCDIQKLEEMIDRIRQLKNRMDFGTLVVKTDRVMDAVWKSLP
jgi:Zn-dependent oligopeptidase